MAKSKAKKKISQKSKDLNFINQMKISKQIKEELLRCTKSKKKWFKQKYEEEKGFEEEITTLQNHAYITRGYLTILLK